MAEIKYKRPYCYLQKITDNNFKLFVLVPHPAGFQVNKTVDTSGTYTQITIDTVSNSSATATEFTHIFTALPAKDVIISVLEASTKIGEYRIAYDLASTDAIVESSNIALDTPYLFVYRKNSGSQALRFPRVAVFFNQDSLYSADAEEAPDGSGDHHYSTIHYTSGANTNPNPGWVFPDTINTSDFNRVVDGHFEVSMSSGGTKKKKNKQRNAYPGPEPGGGNK